MATSTPPRIRPVGSRLCASDVQLVSCLRRKVEKKKSSFIETKNVYECDPWLLVHEPNPLFKKNEWYYFVQRNKRGGTTAKRTVPRNEENEGGTWKTTGIKDIKDEKKKVVVGYKQSLVYNKLVNGDKVKTNWLMTEFSLNKGGNKKEFQDLVLCWLRKKKTKKEENPQVVNQEDQEEVDSNQIENITEGDHGDVTQRQQEDGFTGFANHIENTMMLEGFHGDVTQQQQEENTPMMANNNVMMMIMSNQEDAGFTDELGNMMMLEIDHGDATQQQQQQESPILPLPLPQGENHCLETTWSNMMMLEGEHGDTTRQQQQQQQGEEETQILPLSQGENQGFEMTTTWSNNNNIIVLQNQEEAGFSGFSNQQQQQQQEQKETPILPLSFPISESYGFEMMTTPWSNSNNDVMMSNLDRWDTSYLDDDHDTISIDFIMKFLNEDIDTTQQLQAQ